MQEAGSLKSLQAHTCKREGLDSFLFLIVLSGRGTLHINSIGYPMMALDCALVDCKAPYSHRSSSHDPWELMWVHFNGPHAQNYINYFSENNSSMVFHTDNSTEFSAIISQLIELQKNQDYIVDLLSSKLITDLLTTCFIITKQQKGYCDGIQDLRFESIREYLNMNYQNTIDMLELAARYEVSITDLDDGFRKYYGISVSKYLLTRRLTKAKELLRFTNKSISSVAKACGLENEEALNGHFLDLERITPLQYRMKWSQGS